MKRDQFSMALPFPNELVIDNFAGGGGTSTGLEAAFGRPVDIAINHDPEALAMHAANHPHTLHLCESVWDVNPIQVTGNQPVALVWLSPDCKHFSKAKGGTPVSKHIRGLAWVGMRWVAMCKPRVLMLENVEEFQTWGPILVGPDGQARPDPARRGKTFQSFVRQLKAHGYQVDWRELRASDHGTPTIRKRLFLVARRDGLPIVWPEQTHAEPTDRRVIAGKLAAHRTAAECIDFDLHAESVFGRKRALVDNTMRRVAKGLWKHVLTSANPYIVGAQAPYLNEHANASNQRTMPADAPLRTICAQVKGGHFSVVAPTLAPLRGTSEQHLVGHSVDAPLSTVAASGTHHALVGANLVTIGYGEREGQQPRVQDIDAPLGTVVAGGIKSALAMAHITKFNTGSVGSAIDAPLPTVTAGGTPKRPSTGIQMGMVAAHLVDMGHGEGPAGGKRFSHGIRSLEVPLNTVTASGGTSALAAVHLTHLTHHGERTGNDPREPLRTVTGANRGEQAMVAACLEQANGGFYDGDGRSAADPMSTITSSGTQQRLITAYLVKYYSEGGQDSACSEPMHTVPTKARMGLVHTCQVPAATLAPEHAERARLCAELLHKHLPEHFPNPAELVLMWHADQWWVLVDITLRMLKPRELFRAQGFPRDYHFERVPDPALLFRGGKQAADPRDVPLIDLSTTAQVRMCGNSVCPPLAEALARANFAHEALIYGVAA
ncbi:DNA cytosine methyltransferase [Delftia sp. DT-2]|uniref:DNA cytosine methyltransferase n=1 Tax=Delftia sp. DT-2 TaxID=3022772 RepID=UPI00233E5BA9|nr:DNA cytosine methyltransferase [Delftia sp. DT-2]MDC2861116.1 DNA cytosine methyltransferase [Delftia sp. DT-2]